MSTCLYPPELICTPTPTWTERGFAFGLAKATEVATVTTVRPKMVDNLMFKKTKSTESLCENWIPTRGPQFREWS